VPGGRSEGFGLARSLTRGGASYRAHLNQAAAWGPRRILCPPVSILQDSAELSPVAVGDPIPGTLRLAQEEWALLSPPLTNPLPDCRWAAPGTMLADHPLSRLSPFDSLASRATLPASLASVCDDVVYLSALY